MTGEKAQLAKDSYRHEALSSDPPHPCKKLGMATCVCKPSAGRRKKGEPLKLTSQKVLLKRNEKHVNRVGLISTEKSSKKSKLMCMTSDV